jgi:putative transposase
VPFLTYGPPNVRLIRPKHLPQAVRDAGVALVERKLSSSTVKDLVSISDADWHVACRRFNATQHLAKQPGRLQARVTSIARMFGVTDRTVRRWLSIYRKNPDIVALLPKPRGQRLGTRRLRPDSERLLNDVIDAWASKAERLPVAWILEECKRRTRSTMFGVPSRRAIDARLRDRGLDGLRRQQFIAKEDPAVVLTPRSRKALAIVQMDHTMVDVMLVDEVLRQSMGRPWITVAFDIATRVVLGFALRLESPSATSVGLALTMACLPKDQWLKDRDLDLSWAPFGVPALVHVDNGKEFHSLALTRGCERYGISLEYRPPGRPQFGGHIERYLGTLMRRIHGLPGTTFSNPMARGKYKSEARATMTMSELERWIALEIAGKYHQYVHRGVHAIPAQLWDRSIRRISPTLVTDPERFVIDFLPAETRRVARNGFQINRIRYWDPLLARLFPPRTRVLVRHDPRDLSKVYVPSPSNAEYLPIPYADLRRPPITLAELNRARTMLSAKGTSRPSEDLIFKTTEAQRRIERGAARRSKRARRNLALQPTRPSAKPHKAAEPAVNYDQAVTPYAGEEW